MLAFESQDHARHEPGAADGDGVGGVFRCARKAQGLSGDLLANKTGLSRRTIVKIEAGDVSVAFGSYRLVARALGVEWALDVFRTGTMNSGVSEAPRYYLSGATAL